jgi:hypothetical protein
MHCDRKTRVDTELIGRLRYQVESNARLRRNERGVVVVRTSGARVGWTLAFGAFALTTALSVAPAKAAPISLAVSFSIQGSYDGVNYYGDGSATGSFDITYDPTLAGGQGIPTRASMASSAI